jgi:hypothetical protein
MELAIAASPSGLRAQDATSDDAIAQIREKVLYAQYREALTALEAYLARDDLDAAGRNTGLEILVTIHIARRQTREAEQALRTLYARDPGHRLSESDPSPPVLSAFGRARENPPPPVELTLEHEPPTFDTRTPPEVDVRLGGEGADAVQELRLRYRQGEDDAFTTVVMNVEGDVANARIPLLEERGAYDVEYFVEATAPSGAVLATRGSADAPLSFGVPLAPSGSAGLGVSTLDGEGVERDRVDEGGSDLTWLWVTLGVAVVAGGVALGVVLATSGGPEDGSLGNVELPLVRF